MKNITTLLASPHKAYHAHIYFDQQTLALATQLCEQIAATFTLPIGRIHQRPVGPHPEWSCQISFAQKHLQDFIPWLEQRRQGLTVFVHGISGNDLEDHTLHVYWLGEEKVLDISIFQEA